MKIGVPKESLPGEQRVALTPANVVAIKKISPKIEILFEKEAGLLAGYPDNEYEAAGATLTDRATAYSQSQLLLQVQTPGYAHANADEDLAQLTEGQTLIGMMDPLANPAFAQQLAQQKITGLALELIPRITRAQAMDVLSSMGMLAGYKAVLLAANASPRMFPMNMTAAGTLNAARVLVMGAGVAGLQACATAKRLGAVVEAYDVREAAREQIISVGAKPVELNIDTSAAEGQGGYAQEQSDEFLAQQRAAMQEVVASMDVVITTAAIPGAKSPILVTEDMVKAMKPGSVIVDLAAERGGNCELTQQGNTIVAHDVTIIGPENVPSTLPYHASQMFGKNMENLLKLLLTEEGELQLDFEDEIVRETVVAHEGQVVNTRLRERLGLASQDDNHEKEA